MLVPILCSSQCVDPNLLILFQAYHRKLPTSPKPGPVFPFPSLVFPTYQPLPAHQIPLPLPSKTKFNTTATNSDAQRILGPHLS